MRLRLTSWPIDGVQLMLLSTDRPSIPGQELTVSLKFPHILLALWAHQLMAFIISCKRCHQWAHNYARRDRSARTLFFLKKKKWECACIKIDHVRKSFISIKWNERKKERSLNHWGDILLRDHMFFLFSFISNRNERESVGIVDIRSLETIPIHTFHQPVTP